MKLRSILVLALALVCAPAYAQVTPGTTPLSIAKGGTAAISAPSALTNLGVGSMGTQNANAVAITGGSFTGLATPVNTSDATTKAYVDGLASGLHVLAASRLATAAVLPNTPTYANGASGVGATLTAGASSTLTVDGTVANLNDVILVQNQASAFQNGIYTVTTAGGGVPWVLTRATYFNQSSNMLAGSYTAITAGATNANTSFALAATVTTVGTTAVTFNLFSNAGVTSLGGVTGPVTLDSTLAMTVSQLGVAANAITNAKLAQMAANTVKCNPTGSLANAQDCKAYTLPYTGGIWSNGAGSTPLANISREDRLLIGTATNSTGLHPDTTEDWLETLIPNTTSIAQMASITPLTGIGVLGASRASDSPSASGQGVSAFNNCNQASSLCWGFYGEVWNNTSTTNAAFSTAMELDIVNKNTNLVTIDPYNLNPGGETAGIWLASGGSRSGAQTASVALAILDNGAQFKSGIIFKSTSLNGTSPAALAMPYNYQVAWYTGAGAQSASMAAGVAGGLNFNVGAAVAAALIIDVNAHIDTTPNLAPTLSTCGTGPSVTGNDWAGLIATGTGATACTFTFSHAYNAQPLCILYQQGGTTAVQETSVGLGAITFTAVASGNYIYHCFGRPGG